MKLRVFCTHFLILILGGVGLTGCSDFEDVNRDPFAATEDQVLLEYFINQSITGAQMDPDVAERSFVRYWMDAARMTVAKLSDGHTDDGWTTAYFKKSSAWQTAINTAIQLYEEKAKEGRTAPHDNNLYQVARIWRAYLISEFATVFGVAPIKNGFTGEDPTFNTAEEVYTYTLQELKEAVSKIDQETFPQGNPSISLDPAYAFNFKKWKSFGNSLRMRIAMRMLNMNKDLAQAEFEDAVKDGDYIKENTDNFGVQEKDGWHDLTGVMSRQWNHFILSKTLNNLMLGLGGVESRTMIADAFQSDIDERKKSWTEELDKRKKEYEEKHSTSSYKPWESNKELAVHVKDADYIGVKYPDHFTTATNDPSSGFFFDGLPHSIDPRAYKLFSIPGNIHNGHFNKYPSWASHIATNTERPLKKRREGNKNEVDTVIMLNAAFTWNAFVTGDWDEKGELNELVGYPGCMPRLINDFRNSTMKRISFGAWESYFLLAEAAEYGWKVGEMSAKTAYETGIRKSFEYLDSSLGADFHIAKYLEAYLNSQDYNRCGTSVSFDHTAEPSSTVAMKYMDSADKQLKDYTYTYPENKLYKDGATRNDHLTKIITQKFIANTPWMPLENWSDHRRLGLPFFENPAVEKRISTHPHLNAENVKDCQWKFFPQRIPFPATLSANVPAGYATALTALGGEDSLYTPLAWSLGAIKK